MPYETFWHLNPKKLEPFRSAYQKKADISNYNAWLNGIYVLKAIAACFGNNSKYPSEPYKTVESKAKDDDPEINEKQANAEMRMWAAQLKASGQLKQ